MAMARPSPKYLSFRLIAHTLGWFGLGFGFLQSWPALAAGTIIASVGMVAYFVRPPNSEDRAFWKFHLPWALLHVAIIFVCLPPAQRYYLLAYPLLLLALLRGFLQLPGRWRWSALSLPAVLLFTTIPIAIANHRDPAPPVRLVQFLEKLYPPLTRSRVVLLLGAAGRQAEWYVPEFVTFPEIPQKEKLAEITRDAVAVYTDDQKLVLPKGWRRVPIAEFHRSWIIYMKHHHLHLFLIDRGNPG